MDFPLTTFFCGHVCMCTPITVLKAEGEKCARCWTYSDTVGKNEKHTDLCARCACVID